MKFFNVVFSVVSSLAAIITFVEKFKVTAVPFFLLILTYEVVN